MLIAPSWGGMINGLLTLRGAWDKVREDAVLKFLVVAITAYGMATFEGPMLSLKNVNALAHFTDWIIGHVHIGALGWNGFLTFGVLYWMVPKLWNTQLYSKKLANFHFWIGFLGIVFYAVSMYWSGITQSLMWKQFTSEGILQYPNFLQTVTQIIPMYIVRAIGGTLYLIGVVVMVYNLVKTAKAGKFIPEEEVQAAPLLKESGKKLSHSWLESKPIQFLILSVIAILIGGIVEMIPTFLIKTNIPTIASVKPYTPLELQGRDVYIAQGCNACHSQLVRPFRSETERYGEYSKAGEYVYDHPFLWGSKRTGPDLHREGKLRSNQWHYTHLIDPRSTSPGSIMPPYAWLADDDLDISSTAAKISAMRSLGVPYPEGYEKIADKDLMKQANEIANELIGQGVPAENNKQIIALIAYLQRLGTDIKAAPAGGK
jgi:cytochrome c oxidase cbb3-type subunit I/II